MNDAYFLPLYPCNVQTIEEMEAAEVDHVQEFEAWLQGETSYCDLGCWIEY